MDFELERGPGRRAFSILASSGPVPLGCLRPIDRSFRSTFQSIGFAEASSMNAFELVKDGPIKVLRLPQVCDLTGLCRSMIYQLEADERFPKRVKIGIRAVGWLE